MRRPIIKGEFAIIPLTKGYEAIVDAADAEMVGQFPWFAAVRGNKVYAARSVWMPGTDRSACLLLHRFLIEPRPGFEVDHQDGDGLNNRRSNLREATKSENQRNIAARRNSKTGVKGVSLHKSTGRWIAQIKVNDQHHYLGLYDDIGEASEAYRAAALRLHGEFART